MSTFYDLPAADAPVTLFTHLAIREDAHVLYGFVHEGDRLLFRALLKVSGVGGKMALAILSGMTADEFGVCVQSGDIAALTRLPGVGKRTAERLIVEMRDRLEPLRAATANGGSAATVPGVPHSADGDAVSALIALGYKPLDASKMVRAVTAPGMDTETIIKAALQAAAKQ